MKKIMCVVFALLICMSFALTGCKKSKNPSLGTELVTDENLLGSVHQANEIASPGEAVSEAKIAGDIDTFIKGVFYLEGTMYTEDSEDGMNVNIAMNGQQAIQITTTMSGIYLGIYHEGDKTYVINVAQNTYLELTDSIRKMLGLDDMNMNVDLSSEDGSATKYYNVKINGSDGLCSEVTSKEGNITKLYTIGDKLLQVDSYDKDNNLTSRIVVSSITATIPSNQLTLNGLEKASSFYSFFTKMAGDQ